MGSALANQLRRILPHEAVLDDTLRLSLYGYDGTLYEGTPQLVILPETTEQTAAAVKAAHNAGIPLVPRGAATSLSGGPIPLLGGAVISFTRMDRVLELDYANQRAVVQPGLVNLEFQKILSKDGFFYAPDPASQCVCTLGGNVGENSGGPHCLKYGVTANHVLGLTVVLPDGRILHTGGKSLDAPGYDLTGILVGSEGTFGLVTEITCRIMPLPESVTTMLAIFDSLDGAGQAVSDIIAAGIIPATLEMMDNAMIQAVEKSLHAGYPLDAEAVLIIELDGLGTSIAHQIEQVKSACSRNSVRSFQIAENEEQRALLWKGRKGAFGAVVNIAPSKICTDISVPRSKLPKVLAEVMEISRRWDIPIANVFHAGDGNLHPLVLFDPRDEDQVKRAKSADREITELAVRHGGVLTGEHGIGCGKRQHMFRMFEPSELRLMWRIKEAFDPQGLCNPDKVLPDKAELPPEEPMQLPERTFDEVSDQITPREDGCFRPANQRSIQMLLALANRERQKVILRGAGTKSGEMPENAVIIDISGLNKIISHDHENLTITVECGATLPQIDEVLAHRGQMLALRPRAAGQATLGGIISTNDSGPHRLLYGGPRDMLMGIKAALPNGDIVRFGSSCVKNVAGYAVEKLLIGSHGSLGAILEMTLRTLPRPEVFRSLAMPLDDPAAIAPFLEELLRSGLRSAALELINPSASRIVEKGNGWCLLVGLEGFAADVDEMVGRLNEMAERHGLGRWSELDGDYFELWSKVTDLGNLKSSCPLSATVQLAVELDALDNEVPLRASPGLGLVHCAVGLDSKPQGTALEICRRLKDAFDPNSILPDIL